MEHGHSGDCHGHGHGHGHGTNGRDMWASVLTESDYGIWDYDMYKALDAHFVGSEEVFGCGHALELKTVATGILYVCGCTDMYMCTHVRMYL